jgi:hypothetical protein
LEQTQRAQLLELMDVMYRTNDTPQPDDAATSPAPSLGVAPRSPANPKAKVAAGHAIFSGTAINNDTGKPAEYKELSQSSDGPRWIIAMNKEMGNSVLWNWISSKLAHKDLKTN